MRRPTWPRPSHARPLTPALPLDPSSLSAAVLQAMQPGQHTALIPRGAGEQAADVRTIGKPQRTLGLRPVTAELAADLLIDAFMAYQERRVTLRKASGPAAGH
jgi:hypothetical protein